MSSRNLIIGNTYFKKPLKNYWTWESPNKATHNFIDYIISDHRNILMDATTLPRVDTGSNHRFLRAEVRIDKKMERMRKSEGQRRGT